VTVLFTPFALRDVCLPNRTVVSAMTQYSSVDGFADDYHLVHLGRFALGGFGMVTTECVAVSPQGRCTYGDLGLWHDGQIPALRRVSEFITSQRSVPALQLGHAGHRAGQKRPWVRDGERLQSEDPDGAWLWPLPKPHELTVAEIDAIVDDFVAAARRAVSAGFSVVELHMAHGYLLSSFISPLTNDRNDAYGGDATGRVRLPLRVAGGVRDALPAGVPVCVKLSAIDVAPGGIRIEDTLAFVRELKRLGVDLVVCSTTATRNAPVGYGHQVRWAAQVRAEVGIATTAVGLIVSPMQADRIVTEGRADLVAIGREALSDPNWSARAATTLAPSADGYCVWPRQTGSWLMRRDAILAELGPWQADEDPGS